MSSGTLYLIPSPLGEPDSCASAPEDVRNIVAGLGYFIVEHPKTARRFLKQLGTKTPLQELKLAVLDEHTREDDWEALLFPLLSGQDAGLLSEAGAPAVADPGAGLVRLAHCRGIRVKPLVGPSAILLALMASGLNGQRFAFHGYLPTDTKERKQKLSELEKESAVRDQTQIFIETPYRNAKLFAAMLETCHEDTLLCLATDLSLPTERVVTLRMEEWKRFPPDLEKRPTVFLFLAH